MGPDCRPAAGRFASEQEAALAMTEHLKAKLRKGYVQRGTQHCFLSNCDVQDKVTGRSW
jgi:hypothetical protein